MTNRTEDQRQFSGVIGNLARLAEAIMVVLTVGMVSLVTYQVFQRYVLHYTPPWSEELSVYLMIWFGMLGIAAGVRRSSHMALHFFANKLPKKVQSLLQILTSLMIIAYVVVVGWQGVELVELTMSQRSAAMGVPVGYVYLALPVSAGLIIIFMVEKLYGLWAKREAK